MLPAMFGQTYGGRTARTVAPVAAAVTPEGEAGQAPSAVAAAAPASRTPMAVPLILALAVAAVLRFLFGWGWLAALAVGLVTFFLVRWYRGK